MIDFSAWKDLARVEHIAAVHGLPVATTEWELVAAGWHVDPWLVAWPPGEIEAYLLKYPFRAEERDEAVNHGLRASGLPGTRLYRDMLAKLWGRG